MLHEEKDVQADDDGVTLTQQATDLPKDDLSFCVDTPPASLSAAC
jgi:hypothetical protein